MRHIELYVIVSTVAIGAIVYGRNFLITRSHKASAYYALCIFAFMIIFFITYNIILVIILWVISLIIGIVFPWDYKSSDKNKNVQ